MSVIGNFNDHKREYIIKDMFPKRTLFNYIWNDNFIARLNQFCSGNSFFRDANGSRRLLCKEENSRLIFICDKDNEEYWAANRNYHRLAFDEFYTVVGQGYSKVVSEYKNLKTSFKVFIPTEGAQECWIVEVENTGKTERSISLFTYADVQTNISGHTAYSHGGFNQELNGVLLSHKGFAPSSDLTDVFMACDRKVTRFETTDRRFRGIYGSIQDPDAIRNGYLASEETTFDNQMIAALEFAVTLQPGEKKKFHFILGLSKSIEDAMTTCKEKLSEACFNEELEKIRLASEAFLSKINIHTPDENINRLANIWLKRQMSLGKTWGRVYGKGFRDIMQDTTGFMPLDSKIAAQRIKYCLNYQFENGNTLRQWEPDDFHPYHDGASWLIPAVVCYIKETGNDEFLNEVVNYYGNKEQGTVLEHCLRGINFLFSNLGEHGLCLWGGGDWNDSINNTGMQMKGESLWLSEAAVKSGEELIQLLCRRRLEGYQETVSQLEEKIAHLKINIRQYGWDEDHFIYGYNDWHEKIGAYESEEGKIYLNPQTWAVLAGITGEKDGVQLLDFVEKELSCPFGYVQLKPSYSKGSDHIGRISYMQKGCYENGSVYNHGVAFKIAADCKLGRGNLAYQSLVKMLPLDSDSPTAGSGVEPYVVTNMYLGPENELRQGESLMSWVTGTAGWIFRCMTEFMVGIQAGYDGLEISPCIPSHWDHVQATRVYRNAVYDIRILNPNGVEKGQVRILVDGEPIQGNVLPDFRDGKVHNVLVNMH